MAHTPVVVSLPIADRQTSHAFYRAVLEVEAFGPVADDGVPEPLQFALNDGLTLMLVPTGGFGWVIGDHEVADRGRSEVLLGLPAATEADVDALLDRARVAGARIVTEPGPQPWGYVGAFADPDGHLWMVTADPT